MVGMIKDWFVRQFSDPEAVGLALVILFIFITFWLVGGILSPLITSVIVAYLLTGLVQGLKRLKCPHTLAVSIACLFFVGVFYLGFLVLMPLLWEQLSNLFNEIPKVITIGNDLLVKLHDRYPEIVSVDQMKQVLMSYKSEIGRFGQIIVTYSVSSITSLLSVVIYLFLVPILVFFLLKDSKEIAQWFSRFIPKRRRLIKKVWHEVDDQIGKYIRAKVLEIVIVAVVSSLVFMFFGLKYFLLLGFLTGLSVLIPYVGVAVVTVPVLTVAYLQWGWGAEFGWLTASYILMMILDGNVLGTILFSEAVKLHPVAVIVAILFFGSLWGFWGIFFAIPLATLVKAVINAWPQNVEPELDRQG